MLETLSIERFIELHKRDMSSEDKNTLINYSSESGLDVYLKYESILEEYTTWLESMTLSPSEQMMCNLARRGV